MRQRLLTTILIPKAFGDFQFGYAAAIGAIQGILTTMLSIIVFVYGKRGGMTNNE